MTYVLPMLGLSTTYCHLCSVLWTRGQPGQGPAAQPEHIANKIKDKRKVPLFHDQTPNTRVMCPAAGERDVHRGADRVRAVLAPLPRLLHLQLLRRPRLPGQLSALIGPPHNKYSALIGPPLQPHSQHVFLAFFWLAMANSAVNPIIYFLMNAKCVSRGGILGLLS